MQMKPFIACGTLLARARRGVRHRGAGRDRPVRGRGLPAVCTGTIDSDHSGYSGSGFCNTENETGAYAQFSVNAPAAGTATLRVRFANGTGTARPRTSS